MGKTPELISSSQSPPRSRRLTLLLGPNVVRVDRGGRNPERGPGARETLGPGGEASGVLGSGEMGCGGLAWMVVVWWLGAILRGRG